MNNFHQHQMNSGLNLMGNGGDCNIPTNQNSINSIANHSENSSSLSGAHSNTNHLQNVNMFNDKNIY